MLKEKKTQSYVIAKAIYDRKFDIPDWMYNLVNNEVLLELVNVIPSDTILSRYLSDKNTRFFFNNIKKKINNRKLPVYKIYLLDPDYCIILFDKLNWRTLRKYLISNYDYPKKILDIVVHMASDIDTSKLIPLFLKEMKVGYSVIIEDFVPVAHTLQKLNIIPTFVDALKINESYELSNQCLELGVPVFFKYGDITDLYKYLTVFVEGSWRIPIDHNITRIHLSSEDQEIIELMHRIYETLNRHIIVEAIDMISPDEFGNNFSKDDISSLKSDYTNSVKYGINNFNDLIKIFGHNNYGLPMWTQKQFIRLKGDIKSMFVDGELLPEASILKSSTEISFIIDKLKIDDIRFLLYNSSDFVKNIMTSDFGSKQYIKLAKALFEYPINENLWKILYVGYSNSGTETIMDFRNILVNRISVALTLDGLFLNVPESMLYITPSALFVTRNLKNDNIPFIPLQRLVPTLLSVISTHDYIKFNRYCNGVEVSLLNTMGSDILTKYIVDYGKYGYLGDISEEDCHIMLYKITS